MLTIDTYKFKIKDTDITVTLDESFNKPSLSVELPYLGLHKHALHELFFVGDEPLVITGESKTFEFTNSVVCIPPLFLHSAVRKNDYRILFSSNAEFPNKTNTEPFSVEIKNSQKLYVKEIASQIENPTALSEEVITSLLKLIFCEIYSTKSTDTETHNDNLTDSYFIIIDEIIGKFENNITLKTLANALNLSTKQASRIIRKYYKTTLSDLLNSKRLSVAAVLLANSNMSVAEIIEHINFPSESYFYSRFKKAYGITPLKYRKENQPRH